MTIAIQVIEDRFQTQQSRLGNDAQAGRGSDEQKVRRPTRGTVLKEETFATMRLVTSGGQNILLTDAGGMEGTRTSRKSAVYSNFLLQQVSEDRAEKQQILETFGEPYIFLFGERARMVTFAGVLINTFDFNWEAEWWENYDKLLRGTKCVENDARVFISYDETLVSGYIIATSSTKSSQERNHVQFQFTMFLTGYSNFSNTGDGTATPIRAREEALLNISRSPEDDFLFQVQGPNALTAGDGVTGGVVKPKSLVEGLTDGLATVVSTWNKAQTAVNNATQTLANLARGDIMRVPYGFAGALAYDSVDSVRVKETSGLDGAYGVVKYTEFNDNEDEYVGASSHYGSSSKTNILSDDLDSQTRNQALVEKAKTMWLEAGFALPSEAEAAVASFIIKNGTGLIAASSTAAWQVAEAVDTGLSVANPSPAEAMRAVSPVPVQV